MTSLDLLDARIDGGNIIIIDGGTGTEIPRRGVPLCPETWSARANLEYPDVIREIHEDYIRSGAEIIATNTFWASRPGLRMGNLDDKTVEINQLSVKLAVDARNNVKSNKDVLIAGSMATFFPMDNPRVIPLYEEALQSYREQAQVLAESGVDLFALEMFVRTVDAKAAVQAASEIGLPIWVGYSIQSDGKDLYLGTNEKHGNETIRDAVEAVESLGGVSAFFIMHSDVKDTESGLRILREHTSLPIGAYAHSIDTDALIKPDYLGDTGERIIDRSVDEYLGYARDWIEAGAMIVGGCCGVTPVHIEALNKGLPSNILDFDRS